MIKAQTRNRLHGKLKKKKRKKEEAEKTDIEHEVTVLVGPILR